MAWTKLFDGTSRFVCAGRTDTAAGDLLQFQRVLASPQVSLSVAVCLDETGTEDLKLAAGDLFVRSTAGFDKIKCPATSNSNSVSASLQASLAATLRLTIAVMYSGSFRPSSQASWLLSFASSLSCWYRRRGDTTARQSTRSCTRRQYWRQMHRRTIMQIGCQTSCSPSRARSTANCQRASAMVFE
jgi:hypothetical protein